MEEKDEEEEEDAWLDSDQGTVALCAHIVLYVNYK